MAWDGGPASWGELERVLSGTATAGPPLRDGYARLSDEPQAGDTCGAVEDRVAYAELHCHSNFSFLDGAAHPVELVEEASRLGLDAVALTDHDGLYGAVRFAQAARDNGITAVLGAELSLGLTAAQGGEADPAGEHLLVLARGAEGYRRLCHVLSEAHLCGEEKGRPVYDHGEIDAWLVGHVVILTGCRKGAVRRALAEYGPDAAEKVLRGLVERFGRGSVYVELTDQGLPTDDEDNDQLADLAEAIGVGAVATSAAHYATPEQAPLGQAVAAVRARRSLDEMEGWLPPAGMAHLRSGAEQAERFARFPGAVARAAKVAVECAFDLDLVAPELPPFDVPDGHTEHSYLAELTWAGASEAYGVREAAAQAYAQLEHELRVIGELGFDGYFLIVWELVEFCRARGILCQGRGSAANSAVCYALGITRADPVRWGLLFERFLSAERDGPPDIDLDIEAGRREEAIQHVYLRHGRRHAAQVANVITYRARSAVRDIAKALGYSPGQQDVWSRQIDRWGPVTRAEPDPGEQPIPQLVLNLARQLGDAPRHLGIHSGGMVICRQPVSEVVPVEWATMVDRTVLQWDKDDCAAAGLVKFDLLGLGMLTAIRHTVELIVTRHGDTVDLAQLDLADPAVYDMLCEADAVGVFQVESRAQLATLPRLRPRTFYDLVIQVALIRPGPIQGGSVHPFLRRRNGEQWQHAHPLLARSLDRTLGVPLFQEQVMQMAIDVAGFTPAEADQLRRAMGAKRSTAKMEALRQRFYDGAGANGITGELTSTIFAQVEAFSGYGFPESHAHSFAHIVFTSAWLKRYYPAAFCAGLLRAQPMGFYSPQSLVADARRHGVITRGPDIQHSDADTSLESDPHSTGGQAIRLGLATIRSLSHTAAERIAADRGDSGPYRSVGELAERVQLDTLQMEALATAGAVAGLVDERRRALWQAGAAARHRPGHLPGIAVATDAPALPGMSQLELLAADAHSTGVTPECHPVSLVRCRLDELGALPTSALADVVGGTRVLLGGAVTHRQRPAAAGGITFLSLEDETGIANIVVSEGLWQRHRQVVRTSPALLVRGLAQVADGSSTLQADQLRPLNLGVPIQSRDYR